MCAFPTNPRSNPDPSRVSGPAPQLIRANRFVKMVLFRVAGGKLGRIFSNLGLLLLVAASLSLVSGQQDGVTLSLRGVIIPNGSFVDLDDVMYTAPISCCNDLPSNRNPRDEALKCVTDLVNCCGTESGTVRTERGDWYLPDGSRVGLNGGFSPEFQANRGPNEVLSNGTQIYGSVRFYRRWNPPERGRFHCELPSAADPNVNQILYVYILNFGFNFRNAPVTISPSTAPSTAGRTDYSLTCSVTLFSPSRLPSDTPSPNFQWSFDGSPRSLPSGVTAMPTVMSSSNSTSETYTSTLQLSSPLSQSLHTGMYTCRLGAASLANSAMVTVNPPPISVQIYSSGTLTLRQSYSLTCGVTGAENLNPSTTYQWTKNNGTLTQIPNDESNPEVLSFSSLRLSDAGRYTCQATVSSTYLNNDITMMGTQDIRLGIPAPTSVMLSSNIPNPIPPFGSNVTLTCAVELSPAVDVPVTVNTALTTFEGFTTTRTAQPVMGSSTNNYTTTDVISPFRRSDSGLYSCSATVSLSSTNAYISSSNTRTHSVRVTTGVYLALRGVHITNNSNINIRNIGQTSDNPNGALQCITDHLSCCSRNPQRGEWYLPNGTLVQGAASITTFYRNRGDNGDVTLNRPSGVKSPTGQFCCEVPDAANFNQTLCVNIGGVSISIPSDPPTAGESYTLECSAGGSEGTFQWLGPPDGRTPVDNNSSNVNIVSTAAMSHLQFRPLRLSDNGSYSCRATVGGLALTSEPVVIRINAPTVSVQITTSHGIPVVGQSYSLTCVVNGAENLNASITYQWTKNNGTQTQVVTGTNSKTLSFSHLLPSDTGLYSCNVTILSANVSSVVYANTETFEVTVIIPVPTAVSVHSNSPSPILSGSSPTLTCTVEMKSTVRIPLAVNMEWTGPDGTTIVPITRSKMISFTLYSSSHTLDSVEFADSGEYTCAVKIENEPEVYASTNITIVDGVFQLRLKSVGLCQQWYSENCERSKEYSYFIKGALVKAIERHCRCHFPITNLLNEDLFLYDGSSNLMIYRNVLIGTHNFNGTQITGFIQDWVNTGPLIKINGNPVRVDSSCPTAISSLDEPVCGEKEEKCLYDNDPKYAMCAQHLANNNIANCFEGCVVRNG